MKLLLRCCALLAFAAAALSGQTEEFAGPSVFSRGENGMRPAGPINFRVYANASVLYQSGLTGVIRSQGLLDSTAAAGGEGALGLYGYRNWRHTTLGVNYRGDYRRYNKRSTYDGTNQFLTLGVTHQPTKKISLTVRQGAGTFNQNQGYLGTFGFYDPTFAYIPMNELLDTRTSYYTSMADLTYVRTPRLSFNFGGTGFLVRRGVSAFYGVTGTSARGDAAYRLTRRSTLAADYFFSHFGFKDAFGSADLHSAALDYSVRFSRWWELSLRAGAIRIEMLSRGRVTIDPVIAAIIGKAVAFRAFYQVRTDPTFGVQLSRSFRHGSANVSVRNGASPGNGVHLTSRERTASAGYGYTGMRHWSFQAHAYYADMRSVGQDIGRYETVSGGLSVTRAISSRRNVYTTARLDVRRYLTGTEYNRVFTYASLGVAYSPGSLPLRLW